jgi:hypothetical protein
LPFYTIVRNSISKGVKRMKKLYVSILAVALISMFSVIAFGQPTNKRKSNQTTSPSATPRVKKPVNNSTDSVADYNKPNNRQANSAQRQNKAAERQANQQEKQAQRQAQQQERQTQREQKQKERAEQRQNGRNNRRAGNGQNENMQDVLVTSKKGGRANNNTQSANSANAPTKPCNQLSGTDWLYKGRKCTLENGQVTTVGAYQASQGNVDGTAKTPNAGGNRRANRQNSANTTDTNAGETTTNPRRRQNRNNPPSNIPGATVTPNNSSGNNSNLPNIPSATVTQNNPNLPSIPGATVTPNPSNNSSQNNLPNGSPGNQAQATPPNGNNQANPFGFPYPQRPEDIVTWNPDGGEYGFTTTDQGWEFIRTNAGIAVRRAGREGTVVAHTKCNEPENYDFQQTGNGTRISRIMCIPKRAGLPKLRPSIMIVPRDRYFDDMR